MNRSEVLNEIQETFGSVPNFLENLPDEDLEHEWAIIKRIELSETVLPRKVKNLIGVGISAALRCRYCSLFYTQAARRSGATDAEVQEALLVAKNATGWSAYLNGIQYDYDLFKRELEGIKRFRVEREETKLGEIWEEELLEVGAY